MGQPFFGGTQGEIGKVFGHTSQFQTVQDGFEILMTIDEVRHTSSLLME
jgi:hypothetical protein